MKESNIFICQTCNDDKEFTPKEILVHLQEVHHVDTSKPASRNPILFIDGKDFHKVTYEWQFSGIELIQKITSKKEAEDGKC